MVLMRASLGPACASWCEEGESHATTRIAVVSSPLRSPAPPCLLLACTRRIVGGNGHRCASCHACRSTCSMAGVSRFGVATRPRVGAIPSSLEPRACQDYVVLDCYIACSATKWAGWLLVSQVEVAASDYASTATVAWPTSQNSCARQRVRARNFLSATQRECAMICVSHVQSCYFCRLRAQQQSAGTASWAACASRHELVSSGTHNGTHAPKLGACRCS
jgi:hypothetical protein